MNELLYALAALAAGVFGTHGVHAYKKKYNGTDDAGRIVAAINGLKGAMREEAKVTRDSLDQHERAAAAAVTSFHSQLAGMQQACAVKHTELLGEVRKT